MSTPAPVADDLQAFDAIAQHANGLRQRLHEVIVGQEDIIEPLLAALLCQGHVLLVGVPGLAKTLLVRTLAGALDLQFKRVQCTPDLMPSDILGTELVDQDPQTGQRGMRFVPGPVFTHLLLADEINRAAPRTQAALLEAMAERQVTTAGRTLPLEAPFVVVATQNPIEQEGTYPLPEAQLDRFMLSLWMDYPTSTHEEQIAALPPQAQLQPTTPLATRATVARCAQLISAMPAALPVVQYAVALARATRPSESNAPEITRRYVTWGAGPRATQYLVQASKAAAALAGREAPSRADVAAMAPAVLRHRLILNYAAAGDGIDAAGVVRAVLDEVGTKPG